MAVATLAGGCFWCTEAVFKRVKGVTQTTSGYAGGNTDHPTYDQVILEETGHVEAIQIHFDPSLLSYETIIDIFFATHDPTTVNQQYDVGPMYRSIIFYHDEIQQRVATSKMRENYLTEIVPFTNFFPAEKYHQDFYENNRDRSPYCTIIIDPKIQKLLQKFSGNIKEEYSKR